MNNSGRIDRLDRLFLVVTNHCQARCRLCRYWKSKPREFLSLPVLEEKVIPLIKKYHVGLTLITGGEPTLHPQLPEIIMALETAGTRRTLITNATRLGVVFDTIKNQVDAYMFSLDAGNEALYREIKGLDNFHELITWPGKIVNHRPYTQVAFNCLLQKKNVGDLVNLYRLVVDLPVDGIFFNVPEMKPHCFGRGDTVSGESWENALLDEGEIALLEENLKKIVDLDVGRGKLFQGWNFFDRCVRYFRALGPSRGVELDDPREVCQVPFTSIVVDETPCLHPCFYLPYSVPFINGSKKHSKKTRIFTLVGGTVPPFGEGGDDPVNGEDLRKIRAEIFAHMELRREYCSFCLQFQG